MFGMAALRHKRPFNNRSLCEWTGTRGALLHQPLQLIARVLGALIPVMQQRIRLVDRVHPSHARGHQPPKSRNYFKF